MREMGYRSSDQLRSAVVAFTTLQQGYVRANRLVREQLLAAVGNTAVSRRVVCCLLLGLSVMRTVWRMDAVKRYDTPTTAMTCICIYMVGIVGPRTRRQQQPSKAHGAILCGGEIQHSHAC